MTVTGKYPYLQRARRSSGNPIRRISKRPSALRRLCLLASVAFAAILAGRSATRASPTLTTLATFDNANGALPGPQLLVDATGNLYGTAIQGGANNAGTVFEIAAGTHALSTLVTFDFSNGGGPRGGLIADAAGNLFGTAATGGPGSFGTVFEVAAGTHALSTLATFNNKNGANPEAGVVADSAGNLYGATYQGGAVGDGTVFQVAAGTHALSTLVTFNTTNGSVPYTGVIIDAAGNLYGTTNLGGANGHGTVFEVTAGTHALLTLATFNNTIGAGTHTGLVADAAGNLYGTTDRDGANGVGTVFEVAAGTHTLSIVATLDGVNGATPLQGLIIDAAGNLYGTTVQGGASGYGTVFKVAAGTHALSTLATFDGTNGSSPQALTADAAGNLYGTTFDGGANNDGTVFELTDTGFVTAVPEPAAASLIGVTGLGLLARRRRSL